jgi:quinoprotein glucose dehydrogenase
MSSATRTSRATTRRARRTCPATSWRTTRARAAPLEVQRVPQPGEFGHDTWENDAWQYTGNISSWAPMSADLERGIVYIPTDPPTNDYYGGHRPGNTLFSTSVLALDARPAARLALPDGAPRHLELRQPDRAEPRECARRRPRCADARADDEAELRVRVQPRDGRAGLADRGAAGPAVEVPGEQTSPTQPFPTRPAAYEQQGITSTT